MPVLVTGFTYEQKFVTVANDDTSTNAEITTQAADGWVVTTFILSGTNVIILFSRNVADLPA